MNQLDFKDRTAIVTGGAQGIGLAIARRLVASGARVRIWDRDGERLAGVVKELGATAAGDALDVTDPEHLAALPDKVREHVDGLDGVVHSIAFGPQSVLGGEFLNAQWDDVAKALQVSTYSYQSLAVACLPLLTPGSGIVGLTFDATKAWPVYDWMGVAKAGLESASRYLAMHLGKQGIRSNLVSAGPLRTMAAKSIPGFEQFEEAWAQRAPLGWNLTDQEPAARAVCALLSDWFPATTGEIVHVDGGYHALGA
jgi:enoyl-[acyl-carrier protein] reductase I